MNQPRLIGSASHKRVELRLGAIQKPRLQRAIEIGSQFNYLTVVKFAGVDDGSHRGLKPHRRSYYQCQCICGNLVTVRADVLKKRAYSCGCKTYERQLTQGYPRPKEEQSPLWKGYGNISGWLWASIKRSALSRSLPFQITIEYAWHLFEAQNGICALSGIALVLTRSRSNRTEKTASLDRIDSNLGYVPGNVRWIHKRLNWMRRNDDDATFVSWCKLVASHSENSGV